MIGGMVAQKENGIFTSRALSQVHAEVWEAAGKVRLVHFAIGIKLLKSVKVYIQDVKSRNGTYVNGQRLSPEGVESKPFELKNGDTLVSDRTVSSKPAFTVYFQHLGVDVGTVRRVSGRVFCIMKPEDVKALPQFISSLPTANNK